MKRNFVEEFITPIVKAISKSDTKFFYSIPECIHWRKANSELSQHYFIKYYKGNYFNIKLDVGLLINE